MRADIVAIDELTEPDVGAWRELARRSIEPNPSFEPEFLLPVARALGAAGLGLLRVRDGAEWIACLPVRHQRWRGVPVRALVGERRRYSLLGTPLIDTQRARVAAQALLERASADRSSSFFVVELMASEGPVARLLEELCLELGRHPRRALRFERAVLHRRPQNDYLAVGAKHRREWQRQRRRLAAELQEEISTTDRAGDSSAIDDFLRLEASGWKGEAGTAFAKEPGHDEMFRAICEQFGAAGRLQLLALEAGERRLALKCNLVAGDEIHCFKIAFDQSLAKYSPGIQLELDNMRIFHEETDATLIDSCAWSHNSMINRLWPDRRALDAMVIPTRPLRGRIAAAGIDAASRLRSRRRTSGSRPRA